MNYYFVVRTDTSYHGGVTPNKISNYVYNISRILFGDTTLHMGLQTIELENETQYIVYRPRYTKLVLNSNSISAVRLDGQELEDGTIYLQYEITYSNLDFYSILEDIDVDMVRDALISTLAEVE